MIKNGIIWRKDVLNPFHINGYPYPSAYYTSIADSIYIKKRQQYLLVRNYAFRDRLETILQDVVDWNIDVLALHDLTV